MRIHTTLKGLTMFILPAILLVANVIFISVCFYYDVVVRKNLTDDIAKCEAEARSEHVMLVMNKARTTILKEHESQAYNP